MPSRDVPQLARAAFDAVAGQLTAQERARLAAASDLERIQYRYTHADSALFARTVAAITGWRVVAVNSPGGAGHHLVAMPAASAGALADVTGLVGAADLEQRYGKDLVFAAAAPPPTGHESEDDRLAVLQLLAQLNYAPFNSVAFQRQLLAFCAGQGIPSLQMPPRVTSSAMEQAAVTNDALTASRFLAQALADQSAAPGGNLSTPNLLDPSLLHRCAVRAATQDNVDFVRALLDAADVPLILDCDGNSWLHVAVTYGAMATANLLLEHPRSAHLVRVPNRLNHYTPLHEAAHRANTQMASALIASGAEVDAKLRQCGDTPLHRCVTLDHSYDNEAAQLDMTKLLLAHGADPFLFGGNGASALHHAAGAGLISVVQLLVQHGVPANHAGPGKDSEPPIFVTVTTPHVDMVDALRQLGADPAVYSKAGDTLLTHCIRYSAGDARPLMVQHLLEVVGLDPDQPTLHGDTPDGLAIFLPDTSQVINAFRARRAMAATLATAGPAVGTPRQ